MRQQCVVLCVVILINSVQITGGARLEDRLRDYDTLHYSQITHHLQKRGVNNGETTQHRIVSFTTLGVDFELHLKSNRELFMRNFGAWVVGNGTGQSERLDLDTSDLLTGYVKGDASSRVSAFFHNQDLVVLLQAFNDSYGIEPSSRFLPYSPLYTMISYRLSDINTDVLLQNRSVLCGSDDLSPHLRRQPAPDYLSRKGRGKSDKGSDSNSIRKSRVKRAAPTKNACTLALVADFTFSRWISSNNNVLTAKYMKLIISLVNDIYRATDFNFDGTPDNYGVTIRDIIIHTAPTPVLLSGDHYNNEKNWLSLDLLKAFGKVPWNQVCLAHLFTRQPFDQGRIGLAWIASQYSNYDGGMCSKGSRGYYDNTGISTAQFSGGEPLTTLESSLVVAHEIGHNWGTQHDMPTDAAECLPSAGNGGKYLMFYQLTSGTELNNKVFSPCSRRSINNILEKRRATCFEAVDFDGSFCGNAVLEHNESCDPGTNPADTCCTLECELRSNDYQCSDSNHPCCLNCVYAPSSQICDRSGELVGSCLQNQYCNGITSECPSPKPKEDYTTCGSNGECLDGVCQSFCQARGLIDCQCSDRTSACYHCCTNLPGAACTPYEVEGAWTPLPDGKPCYYGYCSKAVCKELVATNNARSWLISPFVDTNSFLQFMRNNIVLSVCLLTLIIYLPFVVAILIIDHKMHKKWKAWKQADAHSYRVIRTAGQDNQIRSASAGSSHRSRTVLATSLRWRDMYKKHYPKEAIQRYEHFVYDDDSAENNGDASTEPLLKQRQRYNPY